MNGNDFHNYEHHGTYFLKEDALRCVSYDFYFSPTYKYYCNAGCKVCYIKDNLEYGKLFYHLNVPDKITEADTEYWYSIFKNFYSVRTDDDFRYLKLNFPQIYRWYKEHGHNFEFGMTDNSIIGHKNILLNDIDLKGIADITISEEFLNSVNKEKFFSTIRDYASKYSIGHVKIIRTTPEYNHPPIINEVIDFLVKYNVVFSVHQDFRTNEVNRYDIDKFDNQNCYVISDENRRYQIHRSSVHLFNDRYYFSYDDASSYSDMPFHYDTKITFNPKNFLYDVIKGKLQYYKEAINDMKPWNSTAEKFLDYFKTTQEFKLNYDYNFIPEFMLSSNTKFASTLIEYGFRKTKVGLYLPNGEKPVPIVEYK